jgi:hypothetical protein
MHSEFSSEDLARRRSSADRVTVGGMPRVRSAAAPVTASRAGRRAGVVRWPRFVSPSAIAHHDAGMRKVRGVDLDGADPDAARSPPRSAVRALFPPENLPGRLGAGRIPNPLCTRATCAAATSWKHSLRRVVQSEDLMARLLFQGELYEPVAPNAVQAAEYSKLVLENAAVLYPSYVPVPFEMPVRSQRGNCLPHLALIDAEYREWWVVVLETGESPGVEHVSMHIDILRTAKYSEYPKTLAQRNSKLDQEKLANLMKRETPRVFVLVGHPPPPALKQDTACVGVAEIFEHPGSGRRIVRINGVHPAPPADFLTYCARDSFVPAVLLELEKPDRVPPWNGDESEIEIGDVITVWRRTDETITPITACSLPPGARFRLVRTATGRLKLLPA